MVLSQTPMCDGWCVFVTDTEHVMSDDVVLLHTPIMCGDVVLSQTPIMCDEW